MSSNPTDQIKLKIIGCGDAFASGGRFNTCFYLHNDKEHLLVDCGASSLVALKKEAVPLFKINSIVLSHLHGDHYGGIPFFILDAIHLQKRTETLNIIGPEGTEQKTKALTALLYPGTDLDALEFKVEFLEYETYEKLKVGNFEVQAFPVIHSEESQPHGLRIAMKQKIFAYSGDTEWTETLLDIAQDADIFICECNFFGFKGPNHLDYQTLYDQKGRFTCKKILLNHLGAEMLENLNELELDYAFDGQELSV